MSEIQGSRLSFWDLGRKLAPDFRQQPRRLVFAFALITLYVTAGRSLPILLGYAIDEGFKKGNLQLVWQIAMMYLCLDVSRSILGFSQSYLILRMGNQVLFGLRERLILHVQSLPMSYFDRHASGRTVTRVTTDIANLGELFSEGLTAFFISTIEIASIIVALTVIAPRLTVCTLFVLPPLLYATFLISKRIRIQFGKAKRKLASMNASAAETLNGLKVVHLFHRLDVRMAKFAHVSAEYRDLQLKTVRLFAAMWPIVEAFNIGTVVAALLFGSLFYDQIGLTLGQLAAFVLLIQSFFHPLRLILERYNQLQNSLASADRVFELLAQPAEPGVITQPIEKKHPSPSLRLKGEIEYQNVTFRYSVDAPPALKGVSLRIEAGQRVGLVGRTGSGKTSMISLLQRFYPLTEGDIRIDGQSLRAYDLRLLRSRFGVVLQDSFLYRGTLFDNVTLHRAGFSKERVEMAVERAGLGELLRRQGQGLDFQIQERGSNLSHGERQLVAFARIFAFDPDLIILDEATSHIDAISEQKIQRAIHEATQNRTSIVIAHRLSTVVGCDQIVVMEQGQIRELGSHQQLMRAGQIYPKLYAAHLSDGEENSSNNHLSPILSPQH